MNLRHRKLPKIQRKTRNKPTDITKTKISQTKTTCFKDKTGSLIYREKTTNRLKSRYPLMPNLMEG